jgi:hypothetical protein
MQIDAMYDSGTLILPSIRLKHSRFQIQVIIPDAEIMSDSTSDDPVQSNALDAGDTAIPSIVTEIEKILGPWRDKLKDVPPLTKAEMRELRGDEWEEKHRGKT